MKSLESSSEEGGEWEGWVGRKGERHRHIRGSEGPDGESSTEADPFIFTSANQFRKLSVELGDERCYSTEKDWVFCLRSHVI